MMVATKSERILRIRWDGGEDRDFSLDLKRIPFSINQQVSYGMFGLWDVGDSDTNMLVVKSHNIYLLFH